MEVSTLPHRGGTVLSHPRQVLKAFGDERLVDQIRRGNEAAFEVVYERHHRGILSFCRHMLSSQEEAEDVVQHAFVAAYYDIRSSDKDIKLKPWLYTIARNRCLSVLRARRERPAEIDDIPTAGLSEAVQQRDDLRRMLADVQRLPVEQRGALVLSELGDLSHADIAGILGVPTLKVKSLVFQARSSLLESREARDTSCEEIREQLATLRGGALRRGHLKKHLNACPGCRDFREEVRRQRTAMAAILPVVPTAGLKGGIMAAIGGGGGAAGGGAAGLGAGTAAMVGGTAAGGSAGVSGIVSLIGGGGVAKVAAAAVLLSGTAGGVAVVAGGDAERDRPAESASDRAKERSNASAAPVADPARRAPADGAAARRKEKKAKKKAKKDKGAPTLVVNPDGTITSVPRGSGNGGGHANGHAPKGTAPHSRGNSNGSNGTRSRGEPPAHSNGRGRDGVKDSPVPGTAPAPPPPPANSGGGAKKESKAKEPKAPKIPRLPLPLRGGAPGR
ncbi:MAG TPA: RNA polymerase sigma factor [Thermoleophilaceae bacterium]|jgi:RNA polymerase sigma factor (sigma-70 family)